jgi:hypothetical protein
MSTCCRPGTGRLWCWPWPDGYIAWAADRAVSAPRASAAIHRVVRATGEAGQADMSVRPWWQWLLGWLAFVAVLAMLIFYVAAGLLAPAWAVALLLVVWLALVVTAVQLLRRRRPLWVLPVPLAAGLIWWGALTAGETWLGWTG